MSKTAHTLVFLICVCLAVLIHTKELDSSVLWDRYQQTLLSFIRKSNDTKLWVGLQVVTEPLEASWDADSSILSMFLNQASKYGSFYDTTSLTISEEYEQFLFNLNLPSITADSSLQPKLDSLRKQMSDVESKRLDEDKTCTEDYEFYKSLVTPVPEYISFRDKQCPRFTNIHRQLLALNSQLVETRTRVNGPHQVIIDAFSDFVTDTEVGKYQEVGLTLKTFVDRARKNQGTPTSFALNSFTKQDETRTWVYKKKSGFIFTKTKTETKREHRMQSEVFEMRITADSFAAIRVEPRGKWFNWDVVRKYSSDKSMWVNKSRNFFGTSGSMPLLPRTVYVVYNPQVILDVSEADGRFFEQHKSSSFSFGPFASKKGSSLSVKEMTKNNYRVEFKTNNNAPQILAIDNFVL